MSAGRPQRTAFPPAASMPRSMNLPTSTTSRSGKSILAYRRPTRPVVSTGIAAERILSKTSSERWSSHGSTSPVEPSTEMPPATPTPGLSVRLPISAPPGMLRVTDTPSRFSASAASAMLRRIAASAGGLIAGSPMSYRGVFRTNRPTPAPASNEMPDADATASAQKRRSAVISFT